MEQELLKNCIIYCRVSSKEQVEGTSLESQERNCRRYADAHGLKVLEVFVDRGESARTVDRPEFLKAISYCARRKPPVDFFLVYKLDRFARNTNDHLTVRATLKKSGTELRSSTEVVSDDPAGKLMETMIASFAEFDNNVRAERTRLGMRERARAGYWVWAPPIGYHKPMEGKKTNIVPDPARAPLIRRAFEEYAKGIYTYKALAELLEDAGLRMPSGHAVSFQTVEKILHNPIYYGIIRTSGEEYAGCFEAIVTRELFLTCQKKTIGGVTSAPAPRSVSNPEFPLRKFVVCGECGASLTGSAPKGRRGKHYPYYHHQSDRCQKVRFIPKEAFEQQFLEFLDSVSPSVRYQELFKAVVRDVWQSNYRALDDQNAKVRRSLEKLEQERQQIFELHRKGTYSDEDFLSQKKLVNQQIERLEGLLDTRKGERFDMDAALTHCFNFVGNATGTWLNLKDNHPARIRFQQLLFREKLTFDGNKFGTPVLSLVLEQKKTSLVEKSSLVAPRGIEPRLPH